MCVEYVYFDLLVSVYYVMWFELCIDDVCYIFEEVYLYWELELFLCKLDLKVVGICVVVLVIGFVVEWFWLDVQGVLDVYGYLFGEFGVLLQLGLFFIGMYNLQWMSLLFLCNGGCDVCDLLLVILQYFG